MAVIPPLSNEAIPRTSTLLSRLRPDEAWSSCVIFMCNTTYISTAYFDFKHLCFTLHRWTFPNTQWLVVNRSLPLDLSKSEISFVFPLREEPQRRETNMSSVLSKSQYLHRLPFLWTIHFCDRLCLLLQNSREGSIGFGIYLEVFAAPCCLG